MQSLSIVPICVPFFLQFNYKQWENPSQSIRDCIPLRMNVTWCILLAPYLNNCSNRCDFHQNVVYICKRNELFLSLTESVRRQSISFDLASVSQAMCVMCVRIVAVCTCAKPVTQCDAFHPIRRFKSSKKSFARFIESEHSPFRYISLRELSSFSSLVLFGASYCSHIGYIWAFICGLHTHA